MATTYTYPRRVVAGKRAFLAAAEDVRLICQAVNQKHDGRIYGPCHQAEIVADGNEIWFVSGGNIFTVGRCKSRSEVYGSATHADTPAEALAVSAAIIILCHHFEGFLGEFGAEQMGGDADWDPARKLCQEVLGYGLDFELNPPPRFCRWGMVLGGPIPSMLGSWSVRRLPCGWVMNVDRHDRYCRVMDGDNSICSGWSVRKAQWMATLIWLKKEFAEAPEMATFMAAANAGVGDWFPLRVWADKLDDLDSPYGPKLRRLLPLEKKVRTRRA